MKILIVEDNRELALETKNGLEALSYEYWIILRFSGVEAFQQIEKHSFDVIVTDIGLPVINGIGVLKRTKQRAKNKSCYNNNYCI